MRPRLLILAMTVACSREQPRQEDTTAQAFPDLPADSMVLRMGDSAEIWFVTSMLDTGATGAPCYERTLEIRRGGRRTPVPLLYTMGELEVMDDTTVRASLMRDCAPYDTYLVNTKTGQPRRAN